MKSVWKFFTVHLLSDARNKRALFWSLLFPVILLVILVAVFSNLGTTSSINFKVILINEASKSVRGTDYAKLVVNAFRNISYPHKNAFFETELLNTKDVEKAVKEIRYSKADVIVVIPKDFNKAVMRSIFLQKLGLSFVKAKLKVLYLPNSASSRLACDAVESSINEINERVFSPKDRVVDFSLKSETLGETMKSPTYADFVTPGITVIGAFTTALFLIAPKMAFMRQRGVIKKYFSTPASALALFSAFGFSKLFLMMCQYFLVGSISIALGSCVHIFSLASIIYYIFICVVFTLIGLDIAFFSSTTTSVTALTSVVNLPMEFLAGVYFPLFNLPWYMNVLVKVNPLWYATNAMRQFMGVGLSPSSMSMNMLVPALWGGFSALFILAMNMLKGEWT